MNKVHKINSEDQGSLHQWLQGVSFSLYACNAFQVDGTDIALSVVAIGREFPFPIEISPASSREGNSERQQALYHFEAASPLLFRKIEMFNILVSMRSLRHRELRNKGKIMREFDTGEMMVVRNQVNSSRKDR